jgi:hypothetical protein
MDYRSLTKLFVKIGGMLIILYAFNQASASFSLAGSLYAKEGILMNALVVGVLPVLFPLVLGIALFYFPATVANRVLIDDVKPNEAARLPIDRVEEAALVLLSVYILVHSLGDIVYGLSRVKFYYVFVDSQGFPGAPAIMPEDFAQIVAAVFQVVVSLFLFFGARGLIRLKDRFRGRVIEQSR